MRHYSFIGYTIVFILGILIAYIFQLSLIHAFSILILTILIVITNKYLVKNPASGTLVKVCAYLTFFSFGALLFINKQQNKSFMPLDVKDHEEIIIIGEIKSIDLIKEKELTFKVKTDSVRVLNKYIKSEVKLICRVRDRLDNLTKLYDELLHGQKVRMEGIFQKGRTKRNPGEFDYDKYLKSQGISGIFVVANCYEVKKLHWDGNIFLTTIFKIRKYIDSKITSLHNAQTSGLLRGLILADRSSIDEEIKTDFINTGVTHILSVSGLHVGYIFIIFTVLFGRFEIFKRSILIIIGLILFMCLTGFFASVFRSVVMATVLIFSQISNRSTNIFNSIAIAAFIVLAINPDELFDAGFQLSFSAVLSIAVIYPMIESFLKSYKINSLTIKYSFLFMGVSLSAQIGTLPLTLIYFGKLSIVSLITNLFVIPISGLIVGIGILTILIGDLSPFLASVYASANDMLTFIMYKFVSFASHFKYSFLPIRNFSLIDTLLFYSSIILLIVGLKKISSLEGKILFSVLIIINTIFFSQLENNKLFQSGKLNLMMIDLDKGSSILIQFPNGETALIDGGYSSFYFDNGERIIRPLLNHLGIDKIDYAFVSNMTQESYGGFISLIKNGIIKKILKPHSNRNSIVDVKFEELIHSRNIPIKYFAKSILSISDLRIYILNNGIDAISNHQKNSIHKGVIKIVYNNTSFLLPGDMEIDMECFYCNMYQNFLKSDVLIISNSGSAVSSSLEFLNKVQPEISLISIKNRNKINRPSQYILDRLKKINSKIYRTDEEGAIILQSNGNSLTKVNWK
jgi:competence protein ComEC